MGIENVYKLSNPELFDNWTAIIQDWGNLFMLIIYLPSGKRYADWWCKNLRSAKINFTKEMETKGAKWIEGTVR